MPQLNVVDLYPHGSFGENLGNVLSELGADVAHRMDQRAKAKRLAPAFQQLGATHEQAMALAMADPHVQASYLRGAQAAQINAQQQKQQQQEQQQFNDILSGQVQPQQQLQQQQQNPMGFQSLQGLKRQPQQNQQSSMFDLLGRVPQQGIGSQHQQFQVPANQIPQNLDQQQLMRPQQEPLKTTESKWADEIAKIDRHLESPNVSTSIKEKLRKHKEGLEDKLEKRVQLLDKDTKEFYKDTRKAAKSAEANDKRLQRMETLIDQGNLSFPAFAAALETLSKGIFGFGIDLTSITSADSQEFRKLSTDFLKEAKDVFGSRLTDADVKYFLQTVPTLSQSDEGKRRVIKNLYNFNKAAQIRAKTMEDIIAENKGIRPRGLEGLVEKRAAPELDRLSEDFKQR